MILLGDCLIILGSRLDGLLYNTYDVTMSVIRQSSGLTSIQIMEKIMGWIYLVLAGLSEIGWPVGLKMAQSLETRWTGISVAVVFMGVSGFLLWLAQRHIPIGTAYAVWTGIGAAGTFFVGVLYYGDPTSTARYLGVALIIAGVATLKLAH